MREKNLNSDNDQKKKPKKKVHYVDNDTLVKEIEDYKVAIEQAKLSNNIKPRMSETLGKAIYEIANRLSFKDRFIKYSYRDEMVSDAIENCLLYITNFDSKISKYAFAYITKICYHAFFRRIMKEKKQQYVKLKLIENCGIPGMYDLTNDDSSFDKFNFICTDKLREDCKIIMEKEEIETATKLANKKKKNKLKKHSGASLSSLVE